MSEKNSIVVVYDSHEDAEAGVKELQKAQFDIRKLSILGPEYHTEEHTFEGADAAGDPTANSADLYSIGISKDSILRHESALKAEKYLLVTYGTPEEVTRAKDILRITHPEEVNVHFAEEEEVMAPV